MVLKINKMILSDKQFEVLMYLDKFHYMGVVRKKTCVTFSHISILCDYFVRVGLVTKKYSNSKRIKVVLTSKGKKLIELYLQILQVMREE